MIESRGQDSALFDGLEISGACGCGNAENFQVWHCML